MTVEIYKLIEAQMLEKMSGTDCAHDANHVYRVLSNALMLADKYKPDLEVLLPSVLLHDIGRMAEFHDPTVDHALAGANMAYEFLISIGYEKDLALVIKKCIAGHRFSGREKPETLEEKILYDADKLDLTGSMAIARSILAGVAYNEPLYVYQADGTISKGLADGEISFMSFYNTHLKIIGERLFTEKARSIAEQRIKLVDEHYNAMVDEILIPQNYTLNKLNEILK